MHAEPIDISQGLVCASYILRHDNLQSMHAGCQRQQATLRSRMPVLSSLQIVAVVSIDMRRKLQGLAADVVLTTASPALPHARHLAKPLSSFAGSLRTWIRGACMQGVTLWERQSVSMSHTKSDGLL